MKKNLYSIVGLLSPFIVMFLIMDFMIWQSHGYSADYSKIESCLDRGGRWSYEDRGCEYE